MSRVGKKHIVIPEGVTVTLNGNVINVVGNTGKPCKLSALREVDLILQIASVYEDERIAVLDYLLAYLVVCKICSERSWAVFGVVEENIIG